MTSESLVQMVEAVRGGTVSVRELVAAHLQRSTAWQPQLNAYTLIEEEGALARAGQLDAQLGEGKPFGPLAGAPLALKDLIDQRGLPTTCGSSFYRAVAEESAEVVRRLEAAGAVIVGRTGLHEFAFGFSSENPWWGPVHNPWNLSASVGGSSGGSAAAVAAGQAAGAVGTDTGGSVRVPAALCGLVGLKVTHGRVPLQGIFPLAPSLDTVGPIGRSVGDVALLYRVMAGHHPADPWSAPLSVEESGRAAPLGALEVGVPQPWVRSTPAAPDVAQAFERALDRLSDCGARVREVEVAILDPPGQATPIVYGEAGVVHRPWFPRQADQYGADVAKRLWEAQEVTLDAYVQAQAWRSALRHATRALFDRVDLLATPATAVSRKLIGEDLIEVNGQAHHHRRLLSAFTSLVNQMGNPALVAPCASAGEPAPGLQLIGPRWGEHLLLEVGRALEEQGVVAFRPPPPAAHQV